MDTFIRAIFIVLFLMAALIAVSQAVLPIVAMNLQIARFAGQEGWEFHPGILSAEAVKPIRIDHDKCVDSVEAEITDLGGGMYLRVGSTTCPLEIEYLENQKAPKK